MFVYQLADCIKIKSYNAPELSVGNSNIHPTWMQTPCTNPKNHNFIVILTSKFSELLYRNETMKNTSRHISDFKLSDWIVS